MSRDPCVFKKTGHDGCVKGYFTEKQWAELCDYEKDRYCNMKRNFDEMIKLGLNPGTPSWMKPKPQPKPRKRKVPVESEKASENDPLVKRRKESLRKVVPKNYSDMDMDLDSAADDEHTYCDQCKKMIRGFCKEHPLLMVSDKAPAGDYNCSKVSAARHTVPQHLSVRNSSIHGFGVFTEVELCPGVMFGPYKGKLITRPIGSKGDGRNSGYAWKIRSKINQKLGLETLIDAADENESNWLRFVNCARRTSYGSGEEEQNLVAFQYKGNVYYKTFRDVPKDGELLVYYGNDYAQELGIMNQSDQNNGDDEKENGLVLLGENALENLCLTCKIAFPTAEHLTRHNRLHHQERAYACDECDAKYHDAWYLKQHVDAMHCGMGHACQECGKVFTVLTSLKRHMRVHTKEKPFKCSHCDACFRQASNCKRHEESVHHGPKRFVCAVCKKAFGQKGDLEKHMKIHRGEKDYACPHCDYKCCQGSHLKCHVISVHTREFPHVCASCNMGFVRRDRLKKHELKCASVAKD